MNSRERSTLRTSSVLHGMKQFRFPLQSGFALPMAFVMGLVILTVMGASLLEASNRRDTAQVRQSSGASTIVTDSAIARVLVELSRTENSELLTRNYDPINPRTGRNYLGADGIVNTGDELTNGIDQWSNHDTSQQPCAQAEQRLTPTLNQPENRSGLIGPQGRYQLLAYRYDPTGKIGTALVEGTFQNLQSHVQVSISVEPDLKNFPGVGIIRPNNDIRAGAIALRGRQVLGRKSNIYFPPSTSADPNITGISQATDVERPAYLNALWSSIADGSPINSVEGQIVACNLNIGSLPFQGGGENLGRIDASRTLAGNSPNIPTLYQFEKIDLEGNEVLTIDTTNGPVYLETSGNVTLKEASIRLTDNAQILNIRTDGLPPKVGDVRIVSHYGQRPVVLYGRSCIQNVFLHSYVDELRLFSTGPGCPSGLNTNFEGVVWAEAILSSKNNEGNRNVSYLGPEEDRSYDTVVTPNATAGIAVPDDVSSLADVLDYTQLPRSYRYGQILKWQQVRL